MRSNMGFRRPHRNAPRCANKIREEGKETSKKVTDSSIEVIKSNDLLMFKPIECCVGFIFGVIIALIIIRIV